MAKFDLEEFLPYQISILAGRLSRRLEARYYVLFGIRVAEWRMVAHLSQVESASMREIQRRVELHKSRVSRAARRLEAAGYISRTPDASDRRVVELALTGKGRAMMDELLPVTAQFQKELNNELGEHDTAFRTGLTKLLGAKNCH